MALAAIGPTGIRVCPPIPYLSARSHGQIIPGIVTLYPKSPAPIPGHLHAKTITESRPPVKPINLILIKKVGEKNQGREKSGPHPKY